MKEQVNLENELSLKANKFLLLDTNIITTINWSITHFDGYCDPWLIKQAKFLKYDHYLITNIDIPWVKDDLRDRPDNRDEMFSYFKKQLEINKIKHSVVSGDKKERLKRAILILDKIFD